MFTGHPSLRFGDVVHFLQLWKNSPNNLLVFTEPDFPYLEALQPYQPCLMKVINCTIGKNLKQTVNYFKFNFFIFIFFCRYKFNICSSK